jgi:predicted GNAT family acetyltransferase
MTEPGGPPSQQADGLVRRADQDHQYELVVDGRVVSVLGYEERGTAIVLLHTATDPGMRRRGFATRLVAHVLGEAAARKQTVQVRCPFVRSYIRDRS